MAAPQPSVWNLMSESLSASSTLNVIFMMSPQTGLPTSPTPSASSMTPTLRGLLKWSMTFSEYSTWISFWGIVASLRGYFEPNIFGVHGRHRTQALDDRREHLEEVVDVGLGREAAERDA